MTRRITLSICLLWLLAACSSTPEPEPSTIGSLEQAAEPERSTEADTQQAAEASQQLPTDTGDRRRAIEAYERFLEEAPSSELRAEAMRRLADLRFEESEEQAAEAASDSQEIPQEVIDLYEQRLREHPEHPDNDQVLYQLSRAYDYRQDREAAMRALEQLVREHPNSPLLAEAHFRRGESYFMARDFAQAAAAYEDVLALGEETYFTIKRSTSSLGRSSASANTNTASTPS
ncbi:hypothetical protein CAI21_02845 [Alkalilimnicola ehrlichii]|uniref:tetratricopeptide repeat protein n=1 Tax=Alkalilimnicola ehrlichii TaxID=351052 RepID=UPI000E2E916E|nr:tetratricopeptide repeat protein [Alkalilimnicola ehrlichii]RFA30931.1 hypothetical protein CAI21_02845 [Alkalilimnicola ehrlichii]